MVANYERRWFVLKFHLKGEGDWSREKLDKLMPTEDYTKDFVEKTHISVMSRFIGWKCPFEGLKKFAKRGFEGNVILFDEMGGYHKFSIKNREVSHYTGDLVFENLKRRARIVIKSQKQLINQS